MLLSKMCLENGGFLKPLLVPSESMVGPSLSNPSILVDKDGGVTVNLRNLNYVLYHSENGKFEHIWGPLCYLHKENDLRLVTDNIICRLDANLDLSYHSVIDTTFLDVDPIWEFVGLEDGRLVEWGGKTYLIGVRRDTTPNGQGRMEMSEISFKKNKFMETSRTRIPAPGKNDSYCEKNWMPVLDQEFTFVKWTNPTEVVRYDPSKGTTETISLSETMPLGTGDLRGGSQVIPLGDHRIAFVHETNLFNSEAGRKDAIYRHRFVVWDKDWKVVEVSEPLCVLGGSIEFSCGMAEHKDNLLITFGFQDNAAYLLGLPKSILGRILKTYA